MRTYETPTVTPILFDTEDIMVVSTGENALSLNSLRDIFNIK